MMNMRKLSLARKKELFGFLFVAPWLFGFLLLLVVPLYQSIRFSFSKLTIEVTGYAIKNVGFENYRTALLSDPWFNRILTEAISQMVLNVPLIIFFSLFAATLLSQKFRGRAFARAVFFLPVVLASGVIASLDASNLLGQFMSSASTNLEGNFSGFKSVDLKPLLFEAGLDRSIVEYLTGAVDRIYQIISSSGVQIMIFLAGLQSISPSLYEAAKMEGATGYESFWKITFPMVTPLILTNTVYSIIDSFYNNGVTHYMQGITFQQLNFGLSAAMSWIYFIVITVILLISTYALSKRVFYQN
ncbi:lactose ABC transporter permease [Paenibacillus baekrokdamisoli]|uniref:Lactose ABC transporter permease n=2 Tax=Paenibacillus baekrokdamisoli TaxID=1712516 RepID=A0A3G9J410_9BACL|nr:ABC-type sugar transport system permease subunit [Paenibacillus baekrokdamisoli]BBH19453.1 lactose ABC transporter permease [Paenibacillus baekrokdamisoli]